MTDSVCFLLAAFLGAMVGLLSKRAAASGGIALILPLFSVAVLCSVLGRS